MKIKTSFLAFIFLVGGILFSSCDAALAEDNAPGFSISPSFQEINIAKDQDKNPFSIEVKNNTDASAVFRVSVLDFGALDETGGVAFLGPLDNLKYGLASWISLQNDTLVINSGETQDIKGYVENRDSLSPGGHYGAIFLKIENSEETNNKQGIALSPSFSALLFVRKTGGEIFGLNLENKDYPSSLFTLPKSIGLRFQNFGNVHLTPHGIVEIADPFGRIVKKGIINEQSGLILPETFRSFPTKMTDLAKAFIPGRYALTVSYRYDGKDDFMRVNSDFFFVPPCFVWASVLAILFLAAFVYLLKKRKNK